MEVTDTVGLLSRKQVTPKLRVALYRPDPVMEAYFTALAQSAERVGVRISALSIPEDDGRKLTDVVKVWSANPDVHGIMISTPPRWEAHIQPAVDLIPPSKDVDGLNPVSLGRMLAGQPSFAPTETQAVLEILRHHKVPIPLSRVTILGRATRSDLALSMLLARDHATVTVCHTDTEPPPADDLDVDSAPVDVNAVSPLEYARYADIVIVNNELPRSVGADDVLPDAVVIDMARRDATGAIHANVRFEEVGAVAKVTPVPQGVALVQSALRIRNIASAALGRSEQAVGGSR